MVQEGKLKARDKKAIKKFSEKYIVSRSLKYSIPISNRPKYTFKRVHSTKKITRPYQRKLGLRLTSEEFLKVLAPISFQHTSKAF